MVAKHQHPEQHIDDVAEQSANGNASEHDPEIGGEVPDPEQNTDSELPPSSQSHGT